MLLKGETPDPSERHDSVNKDREWLPDDIGRQLRSDGVRRNKQNRQQPIVKFKLLLIFNRKRVKAFLRDESICWDVGERKLHRGANPVMLLLATIPTESVRS